MATVPGGFGVDAVLCDSAVTAEGKLYVQGGGWNILHTNGFPFQQPRIGLAAVLSVPYTETDTTHALDIRLEDEDGGVLPLATMTDGESRTVVRAQFSVGRPPLLPPGAPQNIPIAVNFDQLAFGASGSYAFVLTIDGDEIARLPFLVVATRAAEVEPG